MSYTVINFQTKKRLKEEVFKYLKEHGNPVRAYNPGLGPDLSNYTGRVSLEGPHYPKAHSWYAEAEMKDGIVIKVK